MTNTKTIKTNAITKTTYKTPRITPSRLSNFTHNHAYSTSYILSAFNLPSTTKRSEIASLISSINSYSPSISLNRIPNTHKYLFTSTTSKSTSSSLQVPQGEGDNFSTIKKEPSISYIGSIRYKISSYASLHPNTYYNLKSLIQIIYSISCDDLTFPSICCNELQSLNLSSKHITILNNIIDYVLFNKAYSWIQSFQRVSYATVLWKYIIKDKDGFRSSNQQEGAIIKAMLSKCETKHTREGMKQLKKDISMVLKDKEQNINISYVGKQYKISFKEDMNVSPSLSTVNQKIIDDLNISLHKRLRSYISDTNKIDNTISHKISSTEYSLLEESLNIYTLNLLSKMNFSC